MTSVRIELAVDIVGDLGLFYCRTGNPVSPLPVVDALVCSLQRDDQIRLHINPLLLGQPRTKLRECPCVYGIIF